MDYGLLKMNTSRARNQQQHAHTTIQKDLHSSVGEVNDGADANMQSPLSKLLMHICNLPSIAELERDMIVNDVGGHIKQKELNKTFYLPRWLCCVCVQYTDQTKSCMRTPACVIIVVGYK